MKKNKMYNPLKLSRHRHLYHPIKVLIIGGGAVGSYVLINIVKMGSRVVVVDFDRYTLENAAKHSAVVRTPEDVGRNKAQCLAERAQPYLEDGSTANGIDTDLCMLGPEAIAEFDVVVLCLDNYAAKLLFNELWLQIPEERRPKVIIAGTYDETATSVALDGNKFCLRCLMDESWLQNSDIRTSCGSAQLRMIDGVEEVVRTSGLASSIAGNLASEQFRSIVMEDPEVLNHRITYTAYPNMEMSIGSPIRKSHCPDCGIKPPEEIRWLDGSVLTTTLDAFMEMVGKELGNDDFEIAVHPLNYKNVSYSGFIMRDVCHACGKPISVMKHEGRTYLKDLRCEKCRKEEKSAHYDTGYAPGEIVYAFHKGSEEAMKSMTLFDLGYPLGAHIQVIQRNGALDFLDRDKIQVCTYALREDPAMMHTVQKL